MLVSAEAWIMECTKVFYPDEPLEIEEGDVVCVHSWFVPVFLQNLKIDKPIRIVTSCGDAPLNAVLSEGAMFEFLKSENVLEWRMTQSWYSPHPKITYLPIGFSSQSEYLEKNAERLRTKPKKNAVYYNFTITNKYERLLFPNSPSKSYENYLEEMAGYKYAMCPPGVGVDVHKFYDAVAIGVIPIVKVPEKFVRLYEKYNFVCLPGNSHCTYIMGSPQLTEVAESVYIPENPEIQNSIKLVTVADHTPKNTKQWAIDTLKKIHSYGEYFRKVNIVAPTKSIMDHYRTIHADGKCDHGHVSFL
jgi:hypothetical protein